MAIPTEPIGSIPRPQALLEGILRPAALKKLQAYDVISSRLIPYHGAVLNALGGQIPNPGPSPSDPMFGPFHSFPGFHLRAVAERARTLSGNESGASRKRAGKERNVRCRLVPGQFVAHARGSRRTSILQSCLGREGP